MTIKHILSCRGRKLLGLGAFVEVLFARLRDELQTPGNNFYAVLARSRFADSSIGPT